MGLTPIPGIRGLEHLSAPRIEREVAPAFALDATGRMEDDAFARHGDAEERGLEDEGSEETPEADDNSEASSMPDDQNTTVNFFA